MDAENLIIKAKEDTQKIFELMESCFDKKIELLNEWVVVSCIISDVLKISRKSVDEGMIKCFIEEFNKKI